MNPQNPRNHQDSSNPLDPRNHLDPGIHHNLSISLVPRNPQDPRNCHDHHDPSNLLDPGNHQDPRNHQESPGYQESLLSFMSKSSPGITEPLLARYCRPGRQVAPPRPGPDVWPQELAGTRQLHSGLHTTPLWTLGWPRVHVRRKPI